MKKLNQNLNFLIKKKLVLILVLVTVLLSIVTNNILNSNSFRKLKYTFGKSISFYTHYKENRSKEELYAFNPTSNQILIWNIKTGSLKQEIDLQNCGDIKTNENINEYLCFYITPEKKETKIINLDTVSVQVINAPESENKPPALVLNNTDWLYFNDEDKKIRIWNWQSKKYIFEESISEYFENCAKFQFLIKDNLLHVSAVKQSNLGLRHLLINTINKSFQKLPDAGLFGFTENKNFISLDGKSLIKINSDFLNSEISNAHYDFSEAMIAYKSEEIHLFDHFEHFGKEFLERKNDLFLSMINNNKFTAKKIFDENKLKYFKEVLIPNSSLVVLFDLFGKIVILNTKTMQETKLESKLALRTAAEISVLADFNGNFIILAAENHIVLYNLNEHPASFMLFEL